MRRTERVGQLVRHGAPQLGVVGGEATRRAAAEHVRRAPLRGQDPGEGAVAGGVDRDARASSVSGEGERLGASVGVLQGGGTLVAQHAELGEARRAWFGLGLALGLVQGAVRAGVGDGVGTKILARVREMVG